ncbi:MAG: type II toxin-antitoxin system RelB/DinJ family antitoxin [Acidiferrobacteraceae bacterium]
MATDSVVRARIDTAIKDEATEALAAMGLSVSDAIRLLLTRVETRRIWV